MTSSAQQFPESLSTNDLESLMENAQPDTEYKSETSGPLFDGLTQSQLEALAAKTGEDLYKKCSDPMVHKVLALMILTQMIEYHERVASSIGTTNRDVAIAWAADKGILQSCKVLLMQVNLGENDFVSPVSS